MEKVFKIDNINEYNISNNHKTLHPLVSVIDFSKAEPRDWGEAMSVKFQYGMYCIYLKDIKCGDMRYGRHYYDYQAGTLVFFKPEQTATYDVPRSYQPMGHGLVFHADFLLGTSLGRSIHDYKFFEYQSNEALHLSEDERKMIMDCFAKIDFELRQPIDKHSKKLISANIELFLDYCQRFYDRQFITRENVNHGILERFEEKLKHYFTSEKPHIIGLPSVAYFAEELNLSANYFGDLVKKETGQSAKEYILNRTIEEAKNRIYENNKTVNEIAYGLGFKYPQHFTRLFKQKVGCTPNEFRGLN